MDSTSLFKNNKINKDVFGPTDWVRVMISLNEDGNYRSFK